MRWPRLTGKTPGGIQPPGRQTEKPGCATNAIPCGCAGDAWKPM